MKKSRLVATILVTANVLYLLTACASINSSVDLTTFTTTSTSVDTVTTNTTPMNVETTSINETTTTESTYPAGHEILTFIKEFQDSFKLQVEKLAGGYDNADKHLSYLLARISAFQTHPAMISCFDTLSETNNTLPFNLIKNPYRNIKGNLIEFGYDYIFTDSDNSFAYAKGDHAVATGKFDTKLGCVGFEKRDERATSELWRDVFEVQKINDGVFIAQAIYFFENDASGFSVTASFLLIDGQDVRFYVGGKPDGQIDFTYNSLFDSDNKTLDDLIAGYHIKLEALSVSGKLSYKILTE